MTETMEVTPAGGASEQPAAGAGGPRRPGRWVTVMVAVAFAVLGFGLAVQLRATDDVGERLAIQREEDLARILSELNTQSDLLQAEITDLRLTLAEFETSAEQEELALRSLERRHDDLRVLVGSVEARGPGVVLTVEDPGRAVDQHALLVAIQELRDAGAEAIAVGEQRLVASSSVSERGGRIVVDGTPLERPYRIEAIGPAETVAAALEIPGGALDTFERAGDGVAAAVDLRDELRLPAVSEVRPLVFGRPVAEE